MTEQTHKTAQRCIYCSSLDTKLRPEPHIKEETGKELKVWICDDCYRLSTGDLE